MAASVAGVRKPLGVTLVWTGDTEVRRLNRKHRGIDRTTDVLSFPLAAGGGWPAIGAEGIGDIVISVPEAKREARLRGRGYRDELRLLIVHGFLHLLGYDHMKTSDRKRMFKLQDRALSRLGAGPEVLFSRSLDTD